MKLITLLSLLFLGSFVLAQETITPLLRQPLLAGVEPKEHSSMNKTFTQTGFADYFNKNGTPNKQIWLDSNVMCENGFAVFNALNQNGIVYTNSDGQADVLTSNSLLAGNITEGFVSFTISTGNTYQSGDSLLFQMKNQLGIWQTYYSTANAAPYQTEVMVNFNASNTLLSGLQVRFVLYTNLISGNSQTFVLHNIVLSQKLPFPFYHNFSTNTQDSLPDITYFSSENVKVTTASQYTWGRVVGLNAFTLNNSVFANSGYGGTDTFILNPFDVSKFFVNDSIKLRFNVSSLNLNNSDSLLVEFKNNLGAWVRMLALGSTQTTAFYSFNINWARFRHENFQARFVCKANYNDTVLNKWFIGNIGINRESYLPFIDDFSSSDIKTNDFNWQKNNVFVNNNFPVRQPSLNVATFDGLDANGNAYSKFNEKGITDVLTSQHFNLSALTPADSVIFSFFYQYEPQGVTNQVYPDDSIYLEVNNTPFSNDSFEVVWMLSAKDATLFKFNRFDFVLNNPKWFHGNVLFRIKTRGSKTGNLSQWHVDYIRLDKSRKVNDTYFDVALTNNPRIYLGKYSSMPWKHYAANPAKYGNDTVSLLLKNNNSQNHAVDYFRTVYRPDESVLDNFNNIQPTLFAQSDTIVKFNKPVVFGSTQTSDSMAFKIKYQINISGSSNDDIKTNDTASAFTIFDNYLAYDDGTAEGGYGIKNKTNVGACVKFTFEVPDTLYGVYIYFNKSEADVSTQRFSLKIWNAISSLGLPANNDWVIYSKDYNGPTYTNFLNGFATYNLETPIPVQDSIYIGWEQLASYVLNVGLDKNYPFGINSNQFYKMDGRWYQTEIEGALMIRPILGKFKTWPTAIQKPIPSSLQINVYPNPVTHMLNISGNINQPLTYNIIDLSGRTVLKGLLEHATIDLSALNQGVYLLNLSGVGNANFYNTKIIKN